MVVPIICKTPLRGSITSDLSYILLIFHDDYLYDPILRT